MSAFLPHYQHGSRTLKEDVHVARLREMLPAKRRKLLDQLMGLVLEAELVGDPLLATAAFNAHMALEAAK